MPCLKGLHLHLARETPAEEEEREKREGTVRETECPHGRENNATVNEAEHRVNCCRGLITEVEHEAGSRGASVDEEEHHNVRGYCQ